MLRYICLYGVFPNRRCNSFLLKLLFIPTYVSACSYVWVISTVKHLNNSFVIHCENLNTFMKDPVMTCFGQNFTLSDPRSHLKNTRATKFLHKSTSVVLPHWTIKTPCVASASLQKMWMCGFEIRWQRYVSKGKRTCCSLYDVCICNSKVSEGIFLKTINLRF